MAAIRPKIDLASRWRRFTCFRKDYLSGLNKVSEEIARYYSSNGRTSGFLPLVEIIKMGHPRISNVIRAKGVQALFISIKINPAAGSKDDINEARKIIARAMRAVIRNLVTNGIPTGERKGSIQRGLACQIKIEAPRPDTPRITLTIH